MRPALSVVIPTIGRDELKRTLQSIANQAEPGDEVLVVGDTHGRIPDHIPPMVESFGFRYLTLDAGRYAWGHPQINYGMAEARGDYLVFIDDDDIFTPAAFRAIRSNITELGPYMFRFMITQHENRILWQESVLKESLVGGHMFVVPNIKDKLGQWTDRYAGDFDFIRETADLWGEDRIAWRTELIAVTRPALTWRPVRAPDDVERVRVIRNAGRQWMTRNTDEITPEQQGTWWQREGRNHRLYLFTADGVDVGFGMCRVVDGREWITLAVHPDHRGRGYGTWIYRALGSPGLCAEIRKDNEASRRAALRAGYVLEDSTDTCDILRAS